MGEETDDIIDDTIDDTMMATLADIQGRDDDANIQGETTEKVNEPNVSLDPDAAATGKTSDKITVNRESNGRFKAKDTADLATDDDKVDPDGLANVGVDPDIATGVDEPALDEDALAGLINPPSTWRAAAKLKWAGLDSGIRAEIKKRETDTSLGAMALKERADKYTEVETALAPYESMIRAEGGTPAGVVSQMLNSAYILRSGNLQQKLHLTMQMAQQYGFINELQQAAMAGQIPTPQLQQGLTTEQVDDRFRQLNNAQQQQTDANNLGNDFAAFTTAKNEDGTLRYPYFENVRGLMANLFETDTTGKLTMVDAYNNATWADPDTRTVLLQQAEQKRGAKDQTTEHADKARKAAGNNLAKKGRHAATGQSNSNESIDETLNSTLQAIKAR